MTRVIKTSTIRPYIALIKPGIIRGNVLTAAAGFFLAANGYIDYLLLLAVVLGTSCIIASACICNNYIDREIDALMVRTKSRALVRKTVKARNALLFAALLGIFGAALLAISTNILTFLIGVAGFVLYVFVYSYYKRKTLYGTHIGSISGALPPVAGYTAVTGRIDSAAIILFVILVCWQIAHFFAIALYRYKDYSNAGIPVLPSVKGARTTKVHIIAYVAAYLTVSLLLTVFAYTGYIYAIIMIILCIFWLWLGLHNLQTINDKKWGRSMFLFSLIVISAQSVLLTVNSFVP